MLTYVADHQRVIERQVAALVGSTLELVQDRLRDLASIGLIQRTRVFDEFCCVIRRSGLDAIDSELPVPKGRLGSYKHDIGTAWLWLAARGGTFGPVAKVISERRLRSHDEATTDPGEILAVRLGGYSAKGRPLRHYPDLLLIDHHARRLALELELSPKKIARREHILAGYGADRRIEGVVYLVEDSSEGRAIGRSVRGSAVRMGLQSRVHVSRVMPFELGPSEAVSRSRSPAPARGANRLEAER
jgi:hypothetical protein